MAQDAETVLLLRMEATLARFEKQMARGKKVGKDTAVSTEKQFANSNRKMAKTAEQSAKAIGKEMDRLRSKYDPLFAASKRYENELAELNRAQKVGAINSRQYETALEQINAEYTRATSGADRLASANGRVAGASRGMGGGLQNVAFQVGDFATQVGAGTSASIALGQQLPQLLGGFGVLGAAMGAVVAIGVPVASSFIDIGNSSEELKKLLDDLTDSVDEAERALNRAAHQGRGDLVERYGAITASVRDLVEAQKELSLVQAARQLREAQKELAGFTEVGALDTLRGFVGNAEGEIRKLQHELDITREQATRLKEAFDDIAAAESPRELALALAAARDALVASVGGWENLTDKQVEFIANLNTAQDAAEVMADLIADAGDAMVSLADAAQSVDLSHVISQADMLIGRISSAVRGFGEMLAVVGRAGDRALREEQKLQLQEFEINQRQAGASASEIAGGLAGMRERFRLEGQGIPPAMVQKLIREAEARGAELAVNQGIIQDLNKEDSSGGGGASERLKGLTEAARAAQAVLRQVNKEAVTYKDVVEQLKILLESGEISQEQFNAAVDKAKEKFNEAGREATKTGDKLADMFLSAKQGAESLSDALSNLLDQLAQMAINSAFQSLFSGIGGGGGFWDWLGFADGAAFNKGRVTAFASGGVVNKPTLFPMANGAGLMGEAGPEAIMPLTRTANGKLGVRAEGSQPGRVEVVARVENGNIVQTVREISGEVSVRVVRQGLSEFSRHQLPQRVTQINKDPRARG